MISTVNLSLTHRCDRAIVLRSIGIGKLTGDGMSFGDVVS